MSLNDNLMLETELDTLENKIKGFVFYNKPCVYILTPCYGSVCYVNYVQCLLETIEVFKKFKIDYHIEFCKNDSLVTRARNNLIAKAMSNLKMTHIMFIDNDITWNPIDILKLLVSEKDVIGGIYPKKQYHWERLANTGTVDNWLETKNKSELSNMIDDALLIQHKLLDYNLNHLDNTIRIEKNLIKVKHIATGFMMIKREVIEKMSYSLQETKYTDNVNFLLAGEQKYAYALFDCAVVDGQYYSEDWLFCHRWMKLGGNNWADISINLNHIGIEDYKGSFLSTLI